MSNFKKIIILNEQKLEKRTQRWLENINNSAVRRFSFHNFSITIATIHAVDFLNTVIIMDGATGIDPLFWW